MTTTTTNTSITIIAIVAAIGLLGVVVVTIAVTISLQQQAEAAQPPGKGCEFTPAGNASQGRCIH
jgi:Flp pilus assembly protein CpaB